MTTTRMLASSAALALALFSMPALAQQTDSSASSQSVNNTQVLVGGGGSTGVDYSGSYTIRNVPDAIAPMVSAGTNPCAVGASAAGSMVGFGISAGHTWTDEACERRNLAIILMNASSQFGQPELAAAAIEVLCQHDDVSVALEAVGRPCITRQPQTQQATRPVAARQTAARDDGGDWDWIGSAGR